MVWCLLYANDGRPCRIHKRTVTHARKWMTDVVGGVTAMSFGKKEFADAIADAARSVESWWEAAVVYLTELRAMRFPGIHQD